MRRKKKEGNENPGKTGGRGFDYKVGVVRRRVTTHTLTSKAGVYSEAGRQDSGRERNVCLLELVLGLGWARGKGGGTRMEDGGRRGGEVSKRREYGGDADSAQTAMSRRCESCIADIVSACIIDDRVNYSYS
jgi:hypothetical protein